MNGLKRSELNKVFFGVCGGISEKYNISTFLVRFLFLFTPGGLALYVVLALILPSGLN